MSVLTKIQPFEVTKRTVSLELPGIGSQLDDLRCLEDGWYGHDGQEGTAFRDLDLDWLAATWKRLQPSNIRLPYIYPTPSGKVRAEWTFGRHEIVLEIDIKEHRGRWYCMDMGEPSETNDEERELDLDQPGEWNWVFRKIADFQKQRV